MSGLVPAVPVKVSWEREPAGWVCAVDAGEGRRAEAREAEVRNLKHLDREGLEQVKLAMGRLAVGVLGWPDGAAWQGTARDARSGRINAVWIAPI